MESWERVKAVLRMQGYIRRADTQTFMFEVSAFGFYLDNNSSSFSFI